jgi:8-oxo-dGTP diphosphatase
MKTIEVVAAIIIENSKILCVQRGENKYSYISKKYEFPGGKIEAGETKEDALKREILEELKMEIYDLKEFITISHQYPDFNIIMHSYVCKSQEKQVTLSEHIDFCWLTKDNLNQLDWAEADVPIVNELMKQ